MGRTNPTYRERLSTTEERWKPYRRTLRNTDQQRFDQLFVYARNHADAGGMLNHEAWLAPMWMAIAIEQERRIDDLKERIDQYETEQTNVQN